MSINKHLNYNYDGSYPIIHDDRFCGQDRVNDFRWIQNAMGRMMRDTAGGAVPCILSGGAVSEGALVSGEYTLDISACVGLAEFSVEIMDVFGAAPPSKYTQTIEAVRVTMPTQTSLDISATANYAGATNYCKLRYKELDGETRTRAKGVGSYAYTTSDSFEVVVDSTAPTAADILLAIFTIASSGAHIAALSQMYPIVLYPVGTIFPWMTSNIPGNCLECSGATIAASSYPNLAAAWAGSPLIVGPNIVLPNLRDNYLRGWDHARVLGSYQADQAQGHWHSTLWSDGSWLSYNTATLGGGSVNVPFNYGLVQPDILQARTEITDGTNGTPRIGTKTFPSSIDTMWCVRY